MYVFVVLLLLLLYYLDKNDTMYQLRISINE